MFNVTEIRNDFPALHQLVNNRPLIYFDNAATTQKPQVVINAITQFYTKENSNIHRGVHFLSQKATEAYENSREYIRSFINAEHSHEIIFTKGTTEAINLVAYSFGKAFVMQGDEIIISALEHHSNIVPWQMLCEEKKAILRVLPITQTGDLEIQQLDSLINEKTRLIAIAHISNALGTINPIKGIISKAHQHDIPVLIDGAQGVSHLRVDVQDLDCDFYCFSAHKVYGPMGVGVLYGKEKWLEKMPPYQGGGEMIKIVSFEETIFNELPFKFEAGTPSVGDTLGFNAALKYIDKIGIENIGAYENELLVYATSELNKIEGIRIFGQTPNKASVISFLIDKIHPYDAGTILDKMGIAVRTGHHCAQPLMKFFGIPGTIRASFSFYNTKEEIDSLIQALVQVKQMFN